MQWGKRTSGQPLRFEYDRAAAFLSASPQSSELGGARRHGSFVPILLQKSPNRDLARFRPGCELRLAATASLEAMAGVIALTYQRNLRAVIYRSRNTWSD